MKGPKSIISSFVLTWCSTNIAKFSGKRQLDFTQPFKCQHHKMVKHTQAIRRQQPTNCLSMFDHFVGLALKGLKLYVPPKTGVFNVNILLIKAFLVSFN